MKCPACSNALSPEKFGDITLDICKDGCGGIWFDHGELQSFDERAEFSGNRMLSLPGKKSVTIDREAPRPCPKCETEDLIRLWYDPAQQIELDQCLKCWGLWTDTGELTGIRAQYETMAERQKAADEYLDTNFKSAAEGLAEETKRKVLEEYQKSRPTLLNFFRDWFYEP